MEWIDFIEAEKNKPYYKEMIEKIIEEYANNICHPRYDQIFNAFQQTKLNDVKVVILGQDPYHEIGQAHGLSFSVLCEKLPPSLVNIYKEMSSDLGQEVNQNGDLTYLAKQGVLLLNTVLSVRNGNANSHKKLGWETFTDNAIKLLNTLDQPIVYILWGAPAQSKMKFLNNPKHFIITSPHPSPLSSYRGFFGSRPFSRANAFLKENGVDEIKWIKA